MSTINARISNTRAVTDLRLLYLTITPLYLTINLSMILLYERIALTPFRLTFCPDFTDNLS